MVPNKVKPAGIMIEGVFVVEDEFGHILEHKNGPKKMIYFPYANAVSDYIVEQTRRIEAGDAKEGTQL